MFRNYFITAFRHLIRQKGFTFINVTGLALGLACSLMILLWVQDETGFDRFHEHLDQIYRVEEDQNYNGDIYHVTVTPYPSGPVWRDHVPEIQEAVRLARMNGMLFQYGEKVFFENRIQAADSTLFRVFTFPLEAGNPTRALTDPHSLVLSRKTAEKYFGEEDPLQKVILVNGTPFTVTGVLKDWPKNSSIDFDILVPFDMTKETGSYSESWGNNSISTFVMLEKHADIEAVNEKLTEVYKKHFPEGTTLFMVAPLKKMHLYSYFGFDHRPTGIQYVYIFSLIAAFVLVIACINFMNLSTARATIRSREVGIRKVLGGRKVNLMAQFFGEALIMALISLVLAWIIMASLLDVFNQLAGKEIQLKMLYQPDFLLGMLVITLIAGILAGAYPALMMSSFKPVQVLKGESFGGMKRGTLRKILVVIQFALSAILIVGTMVVYHQLNYMKSKDLGYNQENLFYVGLRGDIKPAYERIRDNFLRSPDVMGVSASWHPPYRIGSNSSGASWPGKPEDFHPLISMNVVDYDFIETMQIEVLEGRSFSREYPSDYMNDSLHTGNFMINEELLKIMDLKEPVIGHPFHFMGVEGSIIGLMKDFHYQPVNSAIEPLALGLGASQFHRYMIVRVRPGNLENTMKELEKLWEESIPGYPFEYHFVDQDLEAQYRSQLRMGQLLKYFSVVAILVASMGIFGLSFFMAERRTREFGIRKAMGAAPRNIAILLSRDFTIVVGIALIIGLPVSWFLMDKWLRNFAYRIELGWWIMAVAALICFTVAWLTVSYHAYRASRTRPADALRYE
ncbi:MAG: ABC transporter permease [Bacteroidales bacterium]